MKQKPDRNVAFNKVVATIVSCTNMIHLTAAIRMRYLFADLYKLYLDDPQLNALRDLIDSKREQLHVI